MERIKPKKMKSNCECCQYYDYDEESDSYVCTLDLDEDEMMRFLTNQTANCPYFNFYDEYKIVEKQN